MTPDQKADYIAWQNKRGAHTQQQWRGQHREQTLWLLAKHRAQRNGIEFCIELDDIVIPELCPILGTPLKAPSLDRIDNSRGYLPGNVGVISRRANAIKGDLTLDQVEALFRYMKRETNPG